MKSNSTMQRPDADVINFQLTSALVYKKKGRCKKWWIFGRVGARALHTRCTAASRRSVWKRPASNFRAPVGFTVRLLLSVSLFLLFSPSALVCFHPSRPFRSCSILPVLCATVTLAATLLRTTPPPPISCLTLTKKYMPIKSFTDCERSELSSPKGPVRPNKGKFSTSKVGSRHFRYRPPFLHVNSSPIPVKFCRWVG